MSKQADAKLIQGYSAKLRNCGRCVHYRSVLDVRTAFGSSWTHESSLRCGIGGFKVMKMGTCNLWELKANE